ncbi:MAG: thioredoxin domain-containing protein, partial [Candidatus Omnitrophica bacterium]|nr:thioredoxin domain-containing protein [Candidatus Omnitrophota bacterium]
MSDTAKPNRLAREKSPYLLQHAHNPVDWYPWGPEAFEKARKENKPIFLSIGYSTCHWCHVMEEESFTNPGIAELLNQYFVSVKVDREERPDVDQVYMQAVQSMSGSGGWPMSVFLTNDLKPFYGGTYFPPEDRWGRPGFSTVLKSLHEKWLNEKESIQQAGKELTEHLAAHAVRAEAETQVLGPETLQTAYAQLDGTFDVRYGGFGRAPKFPRSHDLSLLLRYWKRTGEKKALGMVETTLVEMARGGIYDHLGGGFHRYSTDHKWHVPHFEKMLYDQALLAKTYLEAYQATGKAAYADTARGILDYVRRNLCDEDGGFYSAEDADSLPPPSRHKEGGQAGRGSVPDKAQPHKKIEGAFYVWSAAELQAVLGEELAAIVGDYYGVKPDGNAENDPHGEFTGKNIFYQAHTLEELAEKYGKTHAELTTLLAAARKRLFDVREARPKPHLDDKVLTDWNGLMISAFAMAGRVLNEPVYLQTARRAADFLTAKLRDKHGRLLHRWREGDAAIPAFLDDYAFFIQGLCDLYEAGFEARDLQAA